MHQTAIQSEGFRSLREGEAVEFFVETSEDGRQKVRGGARACREGVLEGALVDVQCRVEPTADCQATGERGGWHVKPGRQLRDSRQPM